MNVSKDWLKQLVTDVDIAEVERLLPLRTIGTKEITKDLIELDMKGYNRADLLSMRGVAYEIAAITDRQVTFEEPKELVWEEEQADSLSVNVEDPQLCPVYALVKIEGLKVEESPAEWKKKLADSGMRAVNNIADITNLIMLEYGQPLHAFDGDKVSGTVTVRRAQANEALLTLDSKQRTLTTDDLVIADELKVLGLAGVMGGKDSEVNEQTTSIVLEAAIFDAGTLRKTSQRYKLYSEASKRFQHGLTKQRLIHALNAAIKMYQQIGGKVKAVAIPQVEVEHPQPIEITTEKINNLIGLELSNDHIQKSLEKLQFHVSHDGDNWQVTPPYFRLDIEIAEDVVEEIARMYGYEKIQAKELAGELPEKIDQNLFTQMEETREQLVKAGLTEVQTYSFFTTAVLDNLVKNCEKLVRILNPMSAETEYMRDELWPNLLEATVKNLKQYDDVAIFEIGKIYQPQEGEIPTERYHLSIALANDSDNPISELQAIVQELVGDTLTIEQSTSDRAAYHPTRQMDIKKDIEVVGRIVEVHPRVVNGFGTQMRVAILELAI